MNYKLFTSLVHSTENELLKNLNDTLKKKYAEIYHTNEYVMAIGNIPVALLAHVDTVFPKPPTHVYYDREQDTIWGDAGLGADDRAGVLIILDILRKGYRPTVIFTTGEEIGGSGAMALLADFPEPPTDLKYLVQLDRRGSIDCVFYDCENPDFTKYIESFGFKTAIGSFTDISYIAPEWKIAAVNLSVGYYNEHTQQEILHPTELDATKNKVVNMLVAADGAEHYIYIESPDAYSWLKYYHPKPKSTSPLAKYYEVDGDYCDMCGNYFYDEWELLPVVQPNGLVDLVCPDCLDKISVSWCEYCGRAFVQKKGEGFKKICIKCERGEFDDDSYRF